MNDHQAKAAELARQRRLFAQAFALGQTGAADRFGRPIGVGDKILFSNEIDLVFDVLAMTPVLDPNQPPNTVEFTLSTSFPVRVSAGMPYGKAIIIQKAEPIRQVPSTDNGSGHEAEDPLPAPEETPTGIRLVD